MGMGGSPCAVESLSHAPGTSSSRDREVNLVSAALGESISFGRFVSESLDWGRWSSFPHNRYLDDVEKYSVPGSVAQKRAYFEAHYKKKASKQVEDQANSITCSDHEREIDNGVGDDANNVNSIEMKDEVKQMSVEVTRNEEEKIEISVAGTCSQQRTNSSTVDEESFCLDQGMVDLEDNTITKDNTFKDSSLRSELFKSPEVTEDAENQCRVLKIEDDVPRPSDKPPLKEIFITNQKNGDSTEKKSRVPIVKSPVVHRPSKIPPSPAKHASSMQRVKENKSPRMGKTYGSSSKKSTPSSLHMSINLAQSHNRVTTPFLSEASSVFEKVKAFNSSSRSSQDCTQPFRNPTSEASNDYPRLLKTPTLKGSQVCRCPSKTPMSKATQDCHHPSQTPTSKASQECFRTPKTLKTASPSGARIHMFTSVTPKSESERIKKVSNQMPSGSTKMDENLHQLSADSKSSSVRRSRARTQIVSSSLSFKIDERVEKRKELCPNFEDNLDLKEAKKLQIQGNGKAEIGLTKVRQSLCFKARPMPDFYKMTRPTKTEVKKVPLTQPRSPKLGRRRNPTAVTDSNP